LFSNADQLNFNLQLNVDHTLPERRGAAIGEFGDDVRRDAAFAPLVANTATLWNVSFDLDAGGWATFSDGVEVARSRDMNGPPDSSEQPLTLGALSNGSWATAADVAELLYYQRALSEAERAAVTTYLSAKWGLGTVNLQ
jgi:hypothetical protein